MTHHWISFMVFTPLLGALLQSFFSSAKSRWIALAASLLSSIFGLVAVMTLLPQTADLQHRESVPWVSAYAMSYTMGIDGLNALLVILIALLIPVLIGVEWRQKTAIHGMHGLFLVLQTALCGAVCAQDLFLQFFFWSLSALPFYFLVGIWGGAGRERAALRAMVVSSVGHALIFSALVLIYYSVEPHSFSIEDLAGGKLEGKVFFFLNQRLSVSQVAFSLVSFGLALRAPIWPFHGDFVEVAGEAPLSVFVALIAGVVPVAIGIFMRICYFLFPEILSESAKIIVLIGVINLIMGGLAAVAQKNLRGLLAFVCLSEVGFILIGMGSLSSAGVVGAVYQTLVMGLSLAGFGLVAGIILDRTGSTDFLDANSDRRLVGGLSLKCPYLAMVAGVVVLSLLGFPGFAGFVGHALLIIGSSAVHPATVVVAGGAFLLASYYLFKMYRFIFFGPPLPANLRASDLDLRERAYLFPLMVGLLFFGFYPKPLIELMRPTILTLLSTLKH